MELTPQTLREVEFREKLRGYHPDDVDEFLEAVAVALDTLLNRLHTAEAAAASSGAVAPAAPVADVLVDEERVTEETLRRTLLLAQKTADLAVAEAQESARQIVATAREEATRMIEEAEGRAADTTREAKERAEASVADLEQRRATLEREVTSLQTWASQQRDRLREVLADQVRALDIWMATSTRVAAPPRAIEAPVESGPDPDAVALPPIGHDAEEVTVVLDGEDDALDDKERLGERLFRRR